MFNLPSRSLIVAQTRRCLWVFAICLVLGLNLSVAHAVQLEQVSTAKDTTTVDNSADELFAASGLKKLVEQIPASTAASFEVALTADQLPILFSAVDEESIRLAVNNAFKQATFNKYLLKELRQGMSQSARQTMLDWYAGELGQRVVKAELENSLLTSQTRFEDYQYFLQRYPVDPVREQLMLNLDYTMKSTEAAVEMMTNIQVAFSVSLARFMPKEYRLSRQEIIDMVESNHEYLWVEYTTQTLEVLLFTYQELSNEELVELNDVLGTQAGQAFVVAINNGIKKGMFASSLDLGDGLGALLDQAPLSPGI